MIFIAEIADKMPSTIMIVATGVAVAGMSVAVASAHRVIARAVLLLGLAAGVLFAVGGYHESFAGPFSDGIRNELGWPWIAATTVVPFAPAIAVGTFIALRRPGVARTPAAQ